MRFHILTIFPHMFDSPFSEGMVRRAMDKGLVEIDVTDIRTFTSDRHRSVDDYTFGGGAIAAAHHAGVPAVLEINSPARDYPGSLRDTLDQLTIVRPVDRWPRRQPGRRPALHTTSPPTTQPHKPTKNTTKKKTHR